MAKEFPLDYLQRLDDIETAMEATQAACEALRSAKSIDDIVTELTSILTAVGAGNSLTRAEKLATISGEGTSVIIAAASDVQVRLHSLFLVMDDTASGTWLVEDSDGTDLFGPFDSDVAPGCNIVNPVGMLTCIVKPIVEKGLTIKTTGTGCTYHAVYSTESV